MSDAKIEKKAYQWNFDRSLNDKMTGEASMSVGLYQWLPTTSGKGLKKSKTIRVKGYAAEAARLYAKARELCDFFNASGVRLNQPPDWLQKQYSVSRPEFFAPEPPSNFLTPSQVRALRQKATSELLLPAGFAAAGKSTTTFWRKRNGQLHCVDFQASKYGGEYTINIAFEYAFMPDRYSGKLFDGRNDSYVSVCGTNARLSSFSSNPAVDWHKYGNDRAQFLKTILENIQLALKVFEEYSIKWQRPELWLEQLDEHGEFPDGCPPWWLNPGHDWLACIARHLRREDIVREQSELYEKDVGESKYRDGQLKRFAKRLRNTVIATRKKARA